jgi:DNA-binding transcriptional MerR regulator
MLRYRVRLRDDPDSSEQLVAIPKLAQAIGVTPRVLRYWEEQGLISPTQEHGKLRYSPRDRAIARLIRLLLDRGASVDGLRMLKELAERDVRLGVSRGEQLMAEVALRLLYERKAFAEETGTDEEHFPDPRPGPPKGHPAPPPKRPHLGPRK